MTLATSSRATSPTTELACGAREAADACVDVLREVVAGLDPDVLLAGEAPEVWELFDTGERLCAAAKVLVARRVEASGAWKDAGMRSAAEYLALQGGTTRDVAREALKTSERVAGLLQVQDALRRGDLSTGQAHVIADAAAHDPTCESALLDQAKVASFKELRDECLRRKAAADPKPENTRDRIYKERYFRLSTDPEGAWRMSGRGPLDHAGIFGATLNPLIDDQYKQARAEGKHETRNAYAYDALQEMARLARAMYYGDDLSEDDIDDLGEHTDTNAHPTGSAPRDAGNTAASAAAGPGSATSASGNARNGSGGAWFADGDQSPLLGHDNPGRAAGSSKRKARRTKKRPNPSHLAILRLDIEALRRGHTQDDELCEIAGVGPVPIQAARNLLGDAVAKLVITKGTAVTTVVHLGRSPTVAQRTALLWTQPECSVEGCCHTFTQIDHRHDWHKAKVTELDNLDRLCNHHHALKTHQNWALVAGIGKRPMVPPTDPRHPRNVPPVETFLPPSTARS